MKKMNIGIIGAGRIGKLHAHNIVKHIPSLSIKAIADPLIDKAWANTLPIAVVTTDYHAMINDPDITAVLICTPSVFHAEQIIAAAESGKHIFCEKPIATDLIHIQQALAAVKKAGVKLQVGFNRRFDPNFAKVREVVSTEQIGKPHMVRITSRDPKMPSAEYLQHSGGMFIDMTIHDFDMARFLMNSDIDEVYASTSVLIDPVFHACDDIDTAIINLKFSNGALGVIDNSRQAAYGYDQRVEVFGSKGAISADNNRLTNTVLSTNDGVVSEKPLYFFLERYEASFVEEMRAFHHAIANDTATAVSGDDGIKSVLISMAAERSRRENRPIKINYQTWSTH